MDQVQILTVAGVLAVLFGTMLYSNLAAARRTQKAAPKLHTWVGRHVQSEGDVLGEVIAEDGDRLVLRKGTTHLVVVRSMVRPQGLDLGLKGPIDMAAAAAEGAAWSHLHGVGAA